MGVELFLVSRILGHSWLRVAWFGLFCEAGVAEVRSGADVLSPWILFFEAHAWELIAENVFREFEVGIGIDLHELHLRTFGSGGLGRFWDEHVAPGGERPGLSADLVGVCLRDPENARLVHLAVVGPRLGLLEERVDGTHVSSSLGLELGSLFGRVWPRDLVLGHVGLRHLEPGLVGELFACVWHGLDPHVLGCLQLLDRRLVHCRRGVHHHWVTLRFGHRCRLLDHGLSLGV